jgi:two-component system, OmpR family, phosphate regulon sensor histidine kinase PhoR
MVALLVIQFFQTAQLYDRKSTEFKAKVGTVLERISIRHEIAHDIRKYMQVVNKDFSGQYKDILKEEFQNLLAVEESVSIKDTSIIENGEIHNFLIIQGKAFDSLSGLSTEHKVLAKDVRKLRELFNRESGVLPKNDSISLTIQLDQRVTQQIFKKAKYVNDMMIEAFRDNIYAEPEKRIDVEFLDSVISHEIKHDGLPLDYVFMVTTEDDSPVNFKFPVPNYKTNLNVGKTLKTELFPENILDEQLYLYLDFPNKKSFLYKEMGSFFLISFGLMILIIIAIFFMFRTILTQKKLAEMKNDFISNMTHEFKTPISTISLACEALNDKDLNENNMNQSKSFVKMIADENKRLGVLVEKILQSAVIDRGELSLRIEKINLNEIIEENCSNAKFRIKSTGGDLVLKLPKETMYIEADKLHTTNLISNLIDNAVKYSKNNPKIEVNLFKENKDVILSVIDNGIGISKEHISRIFDKLYRVPTGNVHNVKGFGLGLSYVKSIADLHGWNIEVQSKINEGSEFKIIMKEKP